MLNKIVKKSYKATFSLAQSSHIMVGVLTSAPLNALISLILARTTPAFPAKPAILQNRRNLGRLRERDQRRPGPASPMSPHTPTSSNISSSKLPSMAAAASESFIHLARPLAPNTVGLQTNLAPLTVNIQPQVRFDCDDPSRLDYHGVLIFEAFVKEPLSTNILSFSSAGCPLHPRPRCPTRHPRYPVHPSHRRSRWHPI